MRAVGLRAAGIFSRGVGISGRAGGIKLKALSDQGKHTLSIDIYICMCVCICIYIYIS